MFTQKNKNNRPNNKVPPKKKSSNEETLEQKKNWQLPIFARNYRRRISA